MKISWTPNAKEAYLATLEYLYDNYKVEVALSLDLKLEALLSKIKLHKNLCPPSKHFNHLRRCVISKYNSLIYTVDKDNIIIIAFYDNRMEINL